MENPSNTTLVEAVRERKAHIISNVETMSMKQARRMLEGDMGLLEGELDSWKDSCKTLVELVVTGQFEKVHGSGGAGKDDRDSEFEDEPPKKKKPKAEATEEKKKKKKKESKKKESKRAEEEEGKKGPLQSKRLDKVKAILKHATIRAPPHIYVNNRSEPSLFLALEGLLRKEGLSVSSGPREIKKVKDRLEIARDTEGIDASNVVTGRRRRTADDVQTPGTLYKDDSGSGSNSDTDDSEEDSSEEDDQEDADGDKENRSSLSEDEEVISKGAGGARRRVVLDESDSE